MDKKLCAILIHVTRYYTITDNISETMKNYSTKNTYGLSDGTRVDSATSKRNISNAGRKVLEEQRSERGYNYCMDCGINGRHAIIDPSHNISVKWCKESGMTELAWDKSNITPRCRACHEVRDKLHLQFKK